MPIAPSFLFNRPFNPSWTGLFRIGLSGILLVAMLLLWTDFSTLFGKERFVDEQLVALRQEIPYLSTASLPDKLLMAVYILCCLQLAAGWYSRIPAVALLVLHHAIFINNTLFSYGFDYLACSALFYCAIFPVHSSYALRFKKTAFIQGPWLTPCLRLLQIHVCIIYFFAGFDKLLGPSWRNGEALWKAVTQPGFDSFLKPDLRALAVYPWLWVAGGWAVILLEMGYPLFIWLRPARRYWLWAIIGLHLGIALLLGLYFFSAIMILLNLCAFYYPYLTTLANQKQFSIPMVQPLSLPAAADETRGEAAGLIQNPPHDMT